MRTEVKIKLAKRCAERAGSVERLDNGTLVVPSVARDPNRTVRAWANHLKIDIESCRMMIKSTSEPGRCWLKPAGQATVIAYG